MGEISQGPRLLDGSDSLVGFDSGNVDLDTWLKRKAILAQLANSARTFVVTDQGRVVAFFSLATGSITLSELPQSLRSGLARHPVPIVLLARLAVDQSYRGLGIARGMLQDAVRKTFLIQKNAGAVALGTHPIDANARSFYSAQGFLNSPKSDRLMLFPLHNLSLPVLGLKE